MMMKEVYGTLLLVSRAAECGQSVRSFGGSDAGALLEERRGDDEDHDMVMPHFQRVHISGEDTSGVSGHIAGLSHGGA